MTSSVLGPTPLGVGPDVSQMRRVIARLADDDFEGRRVGTAGGGAAARWLADLLRQHGAAVALDEFAVSGAAGLLVPRGTDEAGWMPKMIAGPATVDVPVLAVRNDLHEQMRTVAGEATVTASMPLKSVDVTGANVVATFRPARPGRLAVLLTAHFDGVGDDPGLRFPAACDNASGVAVVLEAARVLHQVLPPEVGLAVTLLDAEEAGAHGSAHHAKSVAEGTFVINLDGAAQLADAAHVEAGGPARPLLAALDTAGRQVGVPLRAQGMPSDNRRYAAAGLPAVGIGMGVPGYQTPAETPDRVSPDTLDLASRLAIATVVNLAGSDHAATALD